MCQGSMVITLCCNKQASSYEGCIVCIFFSFVTITQPLIGLLDFSLSSPEYVYIWVRIIESLRLEMTSKIINLNHQPNTTMPAKP